MSIFSFYSECIVATVVVTSELFVVNYIEEEESDGKILQVAIATVTN